MDIDNTAANYLAEKLKEAELELRIYRTSLNFWKRKALLEAEKSGEENATAMLKEANNSMFY